MQISEDVPVGTVMELEWSGLISPSAKAGMKFRAEGLLRAVRAARSRANETFVQPAQLGETIVHYVFHTNR